MLKLPTVTKAARRYCYLHINQIQNRSHMVFKISDAFASERKMSQSVIQLTEMLGMYHAELARILGKLCGDIGKLSAGEYCIQKDSETWPASGSSIWMQFNNPCS